MPANSNPQNSVSSGPGRLPVGSVPSSALLTPTGGGGGGGVTKGVNLDNATVPIAGNPHSVLQLYGLTAVDLGGGVASLTTSPGLNFQGNGTPLAGSPYTTGNFVGLTVTNVGGVATVSLPANLGVSWATTGDIMYFNGTTWVRLPAGTAGEFLTAGTTPGWSTLPLPTDLNITGESTGDLLYYNGTHWVRLPVGSTGALLSVSSGLPTWQTLSTSYYPLFVNNAVTAHSIYTMDVTNSIQDNAIIHGWNATATYLIPISSIGRSVVIHDTTGALENTPIFFALRSIPLSGTFNVTSGMNTVTASISQTGALFPASTLFPGSAITFASQPNTVYQVSTVSGTAIVLSTNYSGTSNAATTALSGGGGFNGGDGLLLTASGTVHATNGSTAVTGTGTRFLEELQVGCVVNINGANCVVSAIGSDTSLTLSATYPWVTTTTGPAVLVSTTYSTNEGTVRFVADGNTWYQF